MIKISYFSVNKLLVGTRLKNSSGRQIGHIESCTPLDSRYSRLEAYVSEDLPLGRIWTDTEGTLKQIKNE